MSEPASERPWSPWPHRLAIVLAAATLLLMLVGGTVTSLNAGDTEPSWSLRFWEWFQPPSQLLEKEGHIWEIGHRQIGTVVGFLAIAFVVLLQRLREKPPAGRDRTALLLGIAALSFLVFALFLHGTLRRRRDWDLFAPAAVPVSLLATRFLARRLDGGRAKRLPVALKDPELRSYAAEALAEVSKDTQDDRAVNQLKDAAVGEERPAVLAAIAGALLDVGGDEARAGASLPTGVAGLAGSVDPSRLTPEALAANPLRIGTDHSGGSQFRGKIGRVTVFRGLQKPEQIRELAAGGPFLVLHSGSTVTHHTAQPAASL